MQSSLKTRETSRSKKELSFDKTVCMQILSDYHLLVSCKKCETDFFETNFFDFGEEKQ